MNILLINPNDIPPFISPVGLEYVGEHLSQFGHNITLSEKVLEGNWDLIGLAVRNIDNTALRPIEFLVPKIRDLVTELRRMSKAPIVIGGTGVNLLPDELHDFIKPDYTVVQKGFGAIDALVHALKQGQEIKPIIKERYGIVSGMFKRNLIDHSPYTNSVGVMTKAGCPFECTYCDYPVADGNRMRLRDIDEIVYEIENLITDSVQQIFFADANFNVPGEHATKLLKTLNERNIKINWQSFTNPHPKHFTDEYLAEVVKSGKRNLSFGVDSLSENVLRYFNKPFGVNDIFNAMKMCQDRGIKYSFPLLFGHAAESTNDINQTFANIDRLNPELVDVVVGIRLFPNTPLHRYCVQDGLVKPDKNLLKPFYLPIPDNNMELIKKEVLARDNCRFSDIDAFEMYEG